MMMSTSIVSNFNLGTFAYSSISRKWKGLGLMLLLPRQKEKNLHTALQALQSS